MSVNENIQKFLAMVATTHNANPEELTETLTMITTMSVGFLRATEGHGFTEGFLLGARADRSNVIELQQMTVQ